MESTSSLLSEHQDRVSLDDNKWEAAWYNEKNAKKRQGYFLKPMLLISFLINIGLIIFVSLGVTSRNTPVARPDDAPAEHYPVSKFAGLRRDIPKQWTYNFATTEDAWVELWNSTPFYAGIISLPDAYAQEKGLPRSQRWPWDPVRGIYIINSFHNFHCVMNIKQSLEEFHEGLPQTVGWQHIQHCLLVLRDEIMCNADDTPRYTGFQNWGSSAYGQERMCRNWTQLEEWAMDPQREGCWRNVPGVIGDKRNDTSNHLLERYRFCSDLNPYKEKAESMWRDPSVWEDSKAL